MQHDSNFDDDYSFHLQLFLMIYLSIWCLKALILCLVVSLELEAPWVLHSFRLLLDLYHPSHTYQLHPAPLPILLDFFLHVFLLGL